MELEHAHCHAAKHLVPKHVQPMQLMQYIPMHAVSHLLLQVLHAPVVGALQGTHAHSRRLHVCLLLLRHAAAVCPLVHGKHIGTPAWTQIGLGASACIPVAKPSHETPCSAMHAHQMASTSTAQTNTSHARMRPMLRRGEQQPSPLRAIEGSRWRWRCGEGIATDARRCTREGEKDILSKVLRR